MTPQRWIQIRQIFDGALERKEADRAAYLRSACGGDDQLRKEVESLLASHHESTGFMAAPAADLNMLAFDLSSAEIPRVQRVGSYELQKRIGRGGMGSVWLGICIDREYPNRVAVKMVKRGMDTAEILRRFRMERQVLAGLDHPNIARLIDAGSASDGSPYLVMEYVEGVPIDQYCEKRKSSITERLQLFRSVCAAVQYAHAHLVVHRDIKAGNILVTKDGTPKLLDFGIAKLIQSDFSPAAAAETRPDLRPMTLEAASPEQVRGEPITTASDIYSLGVLLYKLLTGKLPYATADLRSRAGIEEAICEKEPLRPSQVVLTDEVSVVPDATQKIDLTPEETRDKARRRLKRKLSGDLDTIILKALRKEPQRRYSSAEQFSDDIRRYLEGKPVHARGASLGYRAWKFAQRNAAAVIAAAVMAVLLLASTMWFALAARRSHAEIQAAHDRELATAPELVRAYGKLGDLYLASDTNRASVEFRQAIDTAHEFLRAHPENIDLRKDLAWNEMKLADIDPTGAESLYADAVAQFAAYAKEQPGEAERQKDLMLGERKLGWAQFSQGNLGPALTSFAGALKIADAMPETPDIRRASAAANFELGEVLAANHEPDVAAAAMRKALDLYSGLAGSSGVAVRDRTPAGFEQALAALAEKAPADLRSEITAELNRVRR